MRSLARLMLRTVPGAEPTAFWGVDAAQVVVSQCIDVIDAPAGHVLRRSPATAVRLLSALRVRGVDAGAWTGAGGDPLVAELLMAYTDLFERHGALDPTGVLLRAAEVAPAFVQIRKPTLLLKLDDIHPMPAERVLLERLEDLVPAVETVGRVDDAHAECAPMRRLVARDRDDEAARVLGDILASGTPFDEIQIAMAQPVMYESRLAAAARSHGIPAVVDHGVRLFDTPPGRHVRALLLWLADDLRPDRALACARLGLFNQDKVSVGRRRDVERLLDQWPVDVRALLSPTYRSLVMKAASRQRGAVDSLVHFASTFLQEMLDATGQLRSDVSLSHVMRWIRHVLAAAPERDGTWADLLNSALRGRAAQVLPASFTMSVSKAADVLLRSLEGVRMPGERLLGGSLPGESQVDVDASCGRLLIVPLEQAALSLRRKTWVVGMDDRARSGAAADDTAGLPRTSLDVLRRLGHETPHDQAAPVPIGHLLDRLSGRTAQTTICTARYDVREMRELFPHAACSGRVFAPGVPASMALAPVLAPGAEEGVLRAVAAREKRAGPFWTVQNGIIGQTGMPVENGVVRTASASSLERLSECPYRYFITDVLRVRADEQRTEWITAAERGSLMHDVFRDAFAHGLLASAGGMDTVSELVRERLREHARLSPPPGAYTLRATEVELVSMARTLRALTVEEAAQWTQIAAEWDFDDVDVGPWRLRGRIDRVDVSPRGTERILDYKTGSSSPYEPSKLKKLQHRLQWYVYALVRQHAAQAEVDVSGYLFMKDGEWAALQSVEHPLEYDGMVHLEHLADRVNAGWYPQAAGHPDSPCLFCDVHAVCGDVSMVGDMLKKKTAPDAAFADRLATWWYADKQLDRGVAS